ncbi:MAG: YfiR family protein [Rhodocyclales bacterium]|nr:YfiR family protein [Rhodocyclales bacterium]
MPDLRRLFGTLLGLVLVAGIAFPSTAVYPSDHTVHSEAELRAALLYNFAKFVDWPDKVFEAPDAPVNLCVYGAETSAFATALRPLEGKLARGRAVVVRTGVGREGLRDCQVLFVPGRRERWLPEILGAAHALHILTVGETEGFADSGGIIGFVAVGDHQGFEINVAAARSANLKISSQLLKLARVTNGRVDTQ